MADRKRPRSASSVPYHPLVEALAPDPDKPPKRATRLFGYPGPATDSKSTRLWLDADLSSYVDVPDDAILHSQTLDGERGTILWVDPEATLTHSSPRAQEVQAEFLGGAIVESNLAEASFEAERRGAWGCTGIPFVCRPTLTIAIECPFTTVCRTPLFACPDEVVLRA